MSATVENIQLVFSSSTGGIDTAATKLKGLSSTITGIGTKISGLGTKLTASISAPLAGLIAYGVKSNMTMEDLQTSFKVMLGNEEKAIALTKKLNDLGAVTPFEATQLAEYTKKMINFGYSTEQALPIMSRLGDVSLGGAQKMETLTDAMAKCKGATVLQGEEANRLIDSGFNPLMEIANKTGESMLEVKKRMSEGKVTYEEVEQALIRVTDKGGKFYKGMDEGSKTLSGRLSTLKDNFGAVAREITKPVFDKISTLVPKISDGIQKLSEKFKALDPNTRTMILGLTGLGIVVPPLLIGLGGLVTVVGALVSPITLGIAAVGLLAGGLLAFQLKAEGAEGITKKLKDMWDDMSKFVRGTVVPALHYLATGEGLGLVQDETGNTRNKLFDLRNTLQETAEKFQTFDTGDFSKKLGECFNAVIAVVDALATLIGWIKTAVDFMNNMNDKWQSFSQKVSKGGGNLLNPAINWIASSGGRDKTQSMDEWYNKTFGNKKITEGRPKGYPGYATGTSYAAGGWSMVGERGPELVNLSRGAQVFNNKDTMSMLSSGNTTSRSDRMMHDFNISGTIDIKNGNQLLQLDPNQIKQIVTDVLMGNMSRFVR